MSVENEVAHSEYQLIFHIVNESSLLISTNIKLIEFTKIFSCENGVLLVFEVVVANRNDKPDRLSTKLYFPEFHLIMCEPKISEIDFLKSLGFGIISIQQILVKCRILSILLIKVENIMGTVDW